MSNVPSWWETLLLTGAAFRVWRLLAADVILDRPRDWITGRDDWGEGIKYRATLDMWLHCPWCFGFWITIMVWVAWLIWPTATLIVCVPLALNAAMALAAKNWDT